MSSSPQPDDERRRKLVCAGISVSLGLLALWQTQVSFLRVDGAQEMGKACFVAGFNRSRQDTAFLTKYHDYEPYLGGTFVCILTQFIHGLVVEWPAGFVTWTTTFSSVLPAIVLIVLEAGRHGASGPLRYPSIVLVMSLAFGISVVLPAAWIPAYIWCRPINDNNDHTIQQGNAMHHVRAQWAWVFATPAFVGTALVFGLLDPSTYAWTIATGLLVGPILWMSPAVLGWFTTEHPVTPNDIDQTASSRTVRAAVTSYSIAGAMSFLLWAAVVSTIVVHYRFDVQALLRDCWTDAHGYVRFMTIDAIVLYLGMLVYVGYVRTSAVAETLLATVFFGPGAALAATLAVLELERGPVVAVTTTTKEPQQETDTHSKKD